VRRMVGFCRRGPAAARVDDVAIIKEEYTGKFEGFFILS